MDAIPWGMILLGSLLVRQAVVGRAGQSVSDIRDLSVALLTGHLSDISSVTSLRGSTSTTQAPDPSVGYSTQGHALVTEMHNLAAAAQNRYVMGATGPNAYDCSGLVWRAMYTLGIYKGPRFTSNSFDSVASSAGFAKKIDVPAQLGDVLVWPKHTPGHIGVSLGGDMMYSALNPSAGITESKVSDARPGETPEVWRLT